MKARIEKKLSKRVVELLPSEYNDAWLCKETRMLCVGGGVDYWGEGEDEYTVWEDFKNNFYLFLDFKSYPEGHIFQGMPDTRNFKPTTIRLFKKIRSLNLCAGEK